jgi:hypothetical protein
MTKTSLRNVTLLTAPYHCIWSKGAIIDAECLHTSGGSWDKTYDKTFAIPFAKTFDKTFDKTIGISK